VAGRYSSGRYGYIAGQRYAIYGKFDEDATGLTSTFAGYFINDDDENNSSYSKFGVYGDVTADYGTKYAIYGSSEGDGTNYGVYGKATVSGANNYGIYGEAANGTSNNYGVYGVKSDDNNIGYLGGADYGVYGSVNAGGEYGVYGKNSSTSTSADYGAIKGELTGTGRSAVGILAFYDNAATDKEVGVYGEGGDYGVYGDGNTGTGVYGTSSGTGAPGGYFTNTGDYYALVASVDNSTYMGIYAENSDASGTAILAVGNGGTGSYLTGGSGIAATSSNVGVFGKGDATSNSWGVYGNSAAADGIGVAGKADNDDAGTAGTDYVDFGMTGVYGFGPNHSYGSATAAYRYGVYGSFPDGSNYSNYSAGVIGVFDNSNWGALAYVDGNNYIFGGYFSPMLGLAPQSTQPSGTPLGGLYVRDGGTDIDTLKFYDGAGWQILWPSSGGGGTPGGSDGQIQYNDGGTFGGAADFYYDDANDRVGIGTSSPSCKLSVGGDGSFDRAGWFENTASGGVGLQGKGYRQGVIGEAVASGSDWSEGVRGFSDVASSGYNTGVYGYARNSSDQNTGVYGFASGSNGTKYGGYFKAQDGGTNYGIYATASGGTNNYGVYGKYDDDNYGYIGTEHTGVYGRATTPSDATYNAGLYGYATNTGAARAYGVYASGTDAGGRFNPGVIFNPQAGSTPWATKGMQYMDDDDNTMYYYNGSAWVSMSGGGGGTPGGSDGQIQYNDGGTFGGAADFYYDDANDRVGIGATSPSYKLDVSGTGRFSGDLTAASNLTIGNMLNATATWGENARTQGICIIPEGTVSDDGAGNLTFGSTVIVMNPAAGSWIRVASGTYTLGTWGYLYVDIPPTGTRGTTVTPSVGTWTDGDRNYDNRDRIILAQRMGNGAIFTRFTQPANAPTGDVPTNAVYWIDAGTYIYPEDNASAKVYDSGETYGYYYDGSSNQFAGYFSSSASNNAGCVGSRTSTLPTIANSDVFPYNTTDGMTKTGVLGVGDLYMGVTGHAIWDAGVRGIGIDNIDGTYGTNSAWPICGVIGEVIETGTDDYGQQGVIGWQAAPAGNANYCHGVYGRTSQTGYMSAGVVGQYNDNVGTLVSGYENGTTWGALGLDDGGGLGVQLPNAGDSYTTLTDGAGLIGNSINCGVFGYGIDNGTTDDPSNGGYFTTDDPDGSSAGLVGSQGSGGWGVYSFGPMNVHENADPEIDFYEEGTATWGGIRWNGSNMQYSDDGALSTWTNFGSGGGGLWTDDGTYIYPNNVGSGWQIQDDGDLDVSGSYIYFGSAEYVRDAGANLIEVGGHLRTMTDNSYDLGDASIAWRDLYIDGGIVIDGGRGSSGQVLKSDGTNVYWGTDATGGGGEWTDAGTYVYPNENSSARVYEDNSTYGFYYDAAATYGGYFDGGSYGVRGEGSSSSVYGYLGYSSSYGVYGYCSGGSYGVRGYSTSSTAGVYGYGSGTDYGVYAYSSGYPGLYCDNDATSYYGAEFHAAGSAVYIETDDGSSYYALVLPNSNAGDARAHGWYTYSDRELKKDITPLEKEGYDEVLALIDTTSIYRYKWIESSDTTPQIGLIAQTAPMKFTRESRDGISINQLAVYNTVAIKYLHYLINRLEKQVGLPLSGIGDTSRIFTANPVPLTPYEPPEQ